MAGSPAQPAATDAANDPRVEPALADAPETMVAEILDGELHTEVLIFRWLGSKNVPGGTTRGRSPFCRAYSSPFVFSFESFSLMNARMSSPMSMSFAHCSL